MAGDKLSDEELFEIFVAIGMPICEKGESIISDHFGRMTGRDKTKLNVTIRIFISARRETRVLGGGTGAISGLSPSPEADMSHAREWLTTAFNDAIGELLLLHIEKANDNYARWRKTQ